MTGVQTCALPIFIQFIKISKRLLLITHIITSKLNPISLFILLSFPMIINCSLIVLILYVMPVTVVLTLIIYFASNFNYYQLVYFHIICYYLTIKIRELNQKMEKIIRTNMDLNSGLFYSIMNSMNKLYIEINDYNSNYWSAYLFWIWISLTNLIVSTLFLAIFEKMLIFNISMSFVSIGLMLFLILLIRSASSVNYEANKSYKLMYSLVFSKKKKYLSHSFRIKVFTIF